VSAPKSVVRVLPPGYLVLPPSVAMRVSGVRTTDFEVGSRTPSAYDFGDGRRWRELPRLP
jgi:hypothetical protein